METNNNAQLCENEKEKDETNDINKEPNILKKESNNAIEFYDVYP